MLFVTSIKIETLRTKYWRMLHTLKTIIWIRIQIGGGWSFSPFVVLQISIQSHYHKPIYNPGGSIYNWLNLTFILSKTRPRTNDDQPELQEQHSIVTKLVPNKTGFICIQGKWIPTRNSKKICRVEQVPQGEAMTKDMNERDKVFAMPIAELCSISPPPLTLVAIWPPTHYNLNLKLLSNFP